MLGILGWHVVHAVWVGALAAGTAGLLLARLDDRRAAWRHHVAVGALAVTVLLPVVLVAVAWDPLGPPARIRLTAFVDDTVGFGTLVGWRGPLVRAAGALWLVGVVAGALRVAAGWREVRRLRRESTEVGAGLRAEVASLATRVGLETDVEIRAAVRAAGPMVIGWRRPLILVPGALGAMLGEDERRGILAHELAHVRRADAVVNLGLVATDVVLWWHPAARWLARRARIEREYCCDDFALAHCDSRVAYLRALARLHDVGPGAALTVGGGSGSLLDRMTRIAGYPRSVWTLRRAAATFAGALAIAAIWLSLSLAVPPAVPLDAQLRARTPGPVPLAGPPAAAGQARPRQSRR